MATSYDSFNTKERLQLLTGEIAYEIFRLKSFTQMEYCIAKSPAVIQFDECLQGFCLLKIPYSWQQNYSSMYLVYECRKIKKNDFQIKVNC